MSDQSQMARVKRYIKLTRRSLYTTLDEPETTEYNELARELSTLTGDELLRLITDPLNAGSVIYTLRS